jgi:TfdA family taurine catabolism dioxygenase TauD
LGDFRSFPTAERRPASAMRPVVDPAGWGPDDLRDVSRWSYVLGKSDAAELESAVAAVRRAGISLTEVTQENFPLGAFGETLREVRRELLDGRGIVMLRGFPVLRFDREEQAIAYLGLGAYLGDRISQNAQGHILGHVKDLGGNYADPLTRGYTTNAEMLFHADASDYVGLLCLATSRSGGASRVASSVTVYNRMLAHRPDLVQVLCEDFYRSRSGEVNPGEPSWFKQPIFSFTDGYFSATGAGAAIDKAMTIAGVPPMSPAQQEAVALYRQTVEDCALDIDFQQGDIQFLNNFVMLHTRRAYDDWPDAARKRHLLRLWLSDPNGRPIPKAQREGRSGRGVHLQGVALNAPLDVDAAA